MNSNALKEFHDGITADLAIIPDEGLTQHQLEIRQQKRKAEEEHKNKMIKEFCDLGHHEYVCSHYHKPEYACKYCGKVL